MKFDSVGRKSLNFSLESNMWIRYVLIICLAVIMENTLANAQSASVLEMQCPMVRDYGGYPHTTGEMITYRLNQSKQAVSRRTNGEWMIICKGVSQCSIEGGEVLISEFRADEKKLIDRRLDFARRVEKTKEWGDPARIKLVFGYESRCKSKH